MNVSVVLASYNGIPYLLEQLDSIRMQTHPPEEVLIFDDCSDDGTSEFIIKYIDDWHLHNWIFKKNKTNKGYAKNFLDGIKEAHGDVVFLADQDDVWRKDKIEKMVGAFESCPDAELILSDLEPLYMSDQAPRVNYQTIKRSGKISNTSSWIKPIRPGCTMCVRKNLVFRCEKYWLEGFPHDCLLWGNAVLEGTAYYINEKLIEFRRHDRNASNRGNHDIRYRMDGIQTEINMMTNYIEKYENKEAVAMIGKQRELYQKRLNALQKRSVLSAISLIPSLRYYPRFRYWLTDIFYCLKR